MAVGNLGDAERARNDAAEAQAITQANYTGLIPWLTTIVTEERIQQPGALWVFSSVAADRGRPSNYHYGAAKAGLLRFCEGLLLRCHNTPFAVRILKAGFIASPMTYGKAPPVLCASPEQIACDLLRKPFSRGIETIPWWWRPLMAVVRHTGGRCSSFNAMTTIITNSRATLTGWGRTDPTTAQLCQPHALEQIQSVVSAASPSSLIARGLGRAYGNPAQCAGGTVLDLTGLDHIQLDHSSGCITCSAGASLDSVLRVIVPEGFFLPVSPGTRNVTIGGAIAADVHGKNHHGEGSFASHVNWIKLVDGNGQLRQLSPSDPVTAEAGYCRWHGAYRCDC